MSQQSIGLRAYDGDTPIPSAFSQYVLDSGHNFGLVCGISRVVQFNSNAHTRQSNCEPEGKGAQLNQNGSCLEINCRRAQGALLVQTILAEGYDRLPSKRGS